jgi:hypothetical protein
MYIKFILCIAGETNSARASPDLELGEGIYDYYLIASMGMHSGVNDPPVNEHPPFSDLSAISSPEEPTHMLTYRSKSEEEEDGEENTSRPLIAGKGVIQDRLLKVPQLLSSQDASLDGAEHGNCRRTWRGTNANEMRVNLEGRGGEDGGAARQSKEVYPFSSEGWVSGAFDALVSIFPHRRAVVSKLNLLRNREDAIVSRYTK